jgi:hypothetical protein
MVAHAGQVVQVNVGAGLMTSLTGASSRLTTTGLIGRFSRSRHSSAMSMRVMVRGTPSAICALDWEISALSISLTGLTWPCRSSERSKMTTGNFFCAPRCLMMAVQS